ncbi:MAG: Tn3 family transposase [Clostridium sp.]
MIENMIYNISLSTGNKLSMVKKFIYELKLNKIIIPTISTIEELISKGASTTDDIIYKNIYDQIENKDKLDELLIVDENGVSHFSKIKRTSVNISSNGVKELLAVIKDINEYGAIVDLSLLNESKIRYFTTQVQQSYKIRIERFKDTYKKYSYLAMFLYFKRKEFIDMLIEVISNHAHTILKRSKNKTQEYNYKTQAKYKNNSEQLKIVVTNILDIDIDNFNDFKEYQNSISELKVELDSQEDDLEEIDFLLKSYQSIDYINDLLEVIEFDSNTKPELIKFIRDFKDRGKIKKNNIDISFFDLKWQKNIKKYNYSNKVLDMSLLYTIRDSVRSGDLFIRESKKYNSFDHYLIDSIENTDDKKALNFIDELKNNIKIPKEFELNRDIDTDEKSIFSSKIYSYFPKITIPEILYEVNQWTDFLEDFRVFNQNNSEKQKVLVAALLADGHNIGFSKIAIASSIDESALRRSSELYLNYNNLAMAQKNLVNYHHSLEIVNNWGSGQNSSSDGMRVPISSKTIYADYNAHYGNKGGGIYRHVSDQYTPIMFKCLREEIVIMF